MNYNKKKHLFLIKWLNVILPEFDFFVICYIKPLNTKNSIELRKNLKNVKKLSSSVFKGCLLFNKIVSLHVFTGKLAIVYFNDNDFTEIEQFLSIVQKQKILVPLLYFHSNRFIKTSQVLIKKQLKNHSHIDIFKSEQVKKIDAITCFINFRCYKMLIFHMQNIRSYLMIKKNEE
jgi:ribosomal protein L10